MWTKLIRFRKWNYHSLLSLFKSTPFLYITMPLLHLTSPTTLSLFPSLSVLLFFANPPPPPSADPRAPHPLVGPVASPSSPTLLHLHPRVLRGTWATQPHPATSSPSPTTNLRLQLGGPRASTQDGCWRSKRWVLQAWEQLNIWDFKFKADK